MKPKCEVKEETRKVKDNGVQGRSKEHNFKINEFKQVQKKVNDASKALVKVEYREDHIKIKPNSGNFKVISDQVKKMKVGDMITFQGGATATGAITTGATARVTDQHYQVDAKQIPFMVKTEFSVDDFKTATTKKAVLHTYISSTFFMIQGKGQEEFHEHIMKPFIEKVMKEKLNDIIYINKVLKSMNTAQKRKPDDKTEKCDICGRMFASSGGLKTHTTRAHKKNKRLKGIIFKD